MQRLHAEDPAAEQLLRLSAFLATAPIPLGTFPAAAGHLPPELDASVGDALAFRRVVARIARYGLGRIHGDNLLLHPLAQAIMRDQLPAEQRAVRPPRPRRGPPGHPGLRREPRPHLRLMR